MNRQQLEEKMARRKADFSHPFAESIGRELVARYGIALEDAARMINRSFHRHDIAIASVFPSQRTLDFYVKEIARLEELKPLGGT